MTAARLDSVRLDRMLRVYRDCFTGARGFTFVFSGNIDTAAVVPLLARYIGGLPGAGVNRSPVDRGIQVPPGKQQHIVYTGTENKANVRLVYSRDYVFSPSTNIQLSALGSILGYRMIARIREAEGGAYTPGAGVSYSKFPRNRYAFTVTFTCAPANVKKLVNAVGEEIAKIRQNGPPPG